MFYLAVELWPYLLASAGLGITIGWFSGCDLAQFEAKDSSVDNLRN